MRKDLKVIFKTSAIATMANCSTNKVFIYVGQGKIPKPDIRYPIKPWLWSSEAASKCVEVLKVDNRLFENKKHG